MPTLTLIIIFGSLFLVAALAAAFTYRKRHKFLDYWFYALMPLILIFSMLSTFILVGVQNVEEDTIRILDREGEAFEVLTSGIHYTAEFDSYGESNLDCSPQISEASEAITLDSGIEFLITADLTWQLLCTPDSALRAWKYLDDTVEGANLEKQLFNEYISQKVSSAIEACSPNRVDSDLISPRAVQEHYAILAGNCVAANTEWQSNIVRILGLSNWNARYFSLPVDAPISI